MFLFLGGGVCSSSFLPAVRQGNILPTEMLPPQCARRTWEEAGEGDFINKDREGVLSDGGRNWVWKHVSQIFTPQQPSAKTSSCMHAASTPRRSF